MMEQGGADYIAQTLPRILEVLQESDVRELELREGEIRLRLHRVPARQAEGLAEVLAEAELLPPPESRPMEVTSPLVGTFYRAGKPGAPPLVDEGSHVQIDTVVGIIEALHVLTEVEAGCIGTVIRVLATDGQPVEYGQALFEVTPGE